MSIPIIRWNPVLRQAYQVPLVPEVHRADFRRPEGVVSREAVLKNYTQRQGATLRISVPGVAAAGGNLALWGTRIILFPFQ